MTKRDYIKIARVFKTLKENQPLRGYNDLVINTFIKIAENDNPRFDKNIFIKACGYTENEIK